MEQNKAEVITPLDSEASSEEQVQSSSTDSEMQSSGESLPAAETQPSSPVGEDFGQMFEESMRSVQPGGIVSGRVVSIGSEFVTIDIGYKSEGHIPLAEFRQRDGQLLVNEGDDIEVYFDSADSDQEGEGIVLSRAKAEQFRVWRDIEDAFNNQTPVSGSIV